MRIPLPMGRATFFIAAFAFALVALFPLRIALVWFGLDERGLAARSGEGSIWLGALKEAQVGPVPIGDVSARLNSLPLFLGRARVTLSRSAEAEPFEGAALATRHSFAFEDMSGRLRLGAALAPLPIASVELDDVSAGFVSGQCARAQGRIRAALAGDLGGVAIPSGLSGDARCDGGALLLPLVSQTGLEQLNLRLFADGRYRAELIVRPSDPAVAPRLLAAGFAQSGAGFARVSEGRF